jgi:hypothetical protein
MTLHGKFGDPKTERDILSAKRFNFVSLLVLIMAIVAAFFLYLQLISQQRELEVKTQQLADSTAHLRRIRSELEEAQRSLAKREQQIEMQLENLSNSVELRQFDSALVQATAISSQLARKDSTGLTFINFYAWQPQSSALSAIKSYLTSPEFILVKQETLHQLPIWMGKHSAVYYYSNAAAPKAAAIAKQLSAMAGSPFEVLRGDAQNAPQNGHHEWIHIHYLGGSSHLSR